MAAHPEPVALAKGSLARTEGVGTLGEGMGRRIGGLTGRRSGRELDRGEGLEVGEEGMMRVCYLFKTLIFCFCCFWRLLRRSHPSLGRRRCLERNEKGGVRLISAAFVSSPFVLGAIPRINSPVFVCEKDGSLTCTQDPCMDSLTGVGRCEDAHIFLSLAICHPIDELCSV